MSLTPYTVSCAYAVLQHIYLQICFDLYINNLLNKTISTCLVWTPSSWPSYLESVGTSRTMVSQYSKYLVKGGRKWIPPKPLQHKCLIIKVFCLQLNNSENAYSNWFYDIFFTSQSSPEARGITSSIQTKSFKTFLKTYI